MTFATSGGHSAETVRAGQGFGRVVVLVEDSFRGLLTVSRLARLPLLAGAEVLLLGHAEKDNEVVARRTLEAEARRLSNESRLSVSVDLVGQDFGAGLARIGSKFEPELLIFSRQVAHGLRRFKALQRLRELYARTTHLQVSDRESDPYDSPLVALSEEPEVRALALATRIHPVGPVRALHVRDSSAFAGGHWESGATKERMAEIERQVLDETRHELAKALPSVPGVQQPLLEIGIGDPVEVILDEVKRRGVNLLIAGPRRGPGRAKLGAPDTLERLLLDVTCDMAVAPREG